MMNLTHSRHFRAGVISFMYGQFTCVGIVEGILDDKHVPASDSPLLRTVTSTRKQFPNNARDVHKCHPGVRHCHLVSAHDTLTHVRYRHRVRYRNPESRPHVKANDKTSPLIPPRSPLYTP